MSKVFCKKGDIKNAHKIKSVEDLLILLLKNTGFSGMILIIKTR